jgi:hypothetical protein
MGNIPQEKSILEADLFPFSLTWKVFVEINK